MEIQRGKGQAWARRQINQATDVFAIFTRIFKTLGVFLEIKFWSTRITGINFRLQPCIANLDKILETYLDERVCYGKIYT